MEHFADIAGGLGVLLVMVAYFLLQKEVISEISGWYLGINLVGPMLIMLSLLQNWNLPVFLLEAAWALISIYGIYKHIYLKHISLPGRDAK